MSALMLAMGCTAPPPHVPSVPPPAVPVSRPVERDVTETVDFTGRTEAIGAVDIRSRVSGYLVGASFKEGAEVKKGDQLFEIDPRPYRAQLRQAQAQVELFKAQLHLAQKTYDRNRPLVATGAVTPEEFDQLKAAVDEAAARIEAHTASLDVYRLNLDFTRIVAPIDGQVGRFYLTVGNLVNQDQSVLTSVVSRDPIYVYFEMDEPTMVRVRLAINAGAIRQPEEGPYPVFMSLRKGDDYSREGTVNFVNNRVNPGTGSIAVRGVFSNPKPANGTRVLSPGMFVRIRLPLGQPRPALLVIDRAIGSSQGLKYVYVVDAANKVEQRRIATGAIQEDGLRVVTSGLKADDWVVVGGLPQIRPHMLVRRDPVAMPTLALPAK